MQESLTTATWLWLIIPMMSVVVLSLITYLMSRGDK